MHCNIMAHCRKAALSGKNRPNPVARLQLS